MQVLRRFVLHTGKTALVVEHDLLMSSCMADRVVVFDGDPGKAAAAAAPVPADGGLADFLGRILGVTFRRDATNGRPRMNKPNGVRDRQQKAAGKFFCPNDEEEKEAE